MIIGILGNVGTGKTLLLTFSLCYDLEHGRTCFSNYHVFYKTKDGRKVKYIDTGELFKWLNTEQNRFKPGSASLALDELYMDMDSRASQSRSNRLLSHFVFQSRKLGLDLYFSAQLSSSLDKRIKNLTDVWIIAEKKEEPVYNFDKSEIIEMKPTFMYTMLDTDGELVDFKIPAEDAAKVYNLYSTAEIVDPSMISISKKEAKAFEKNIKDVQKKRRRKTLEEIGELK